MPAVTAELTALAQDGYFRQRVRNLVLLEAAVVVAENVNTALHAQRVAFAFTLIKAPGLCDGLADVLCARTNLVASVITYDFNRRAVVTDATDAAIRSQIATDWNLLAGAQ